MLLCGISLVWYNIHIVVTGYAFGLKHQVIFLKPRRSFNRTFWKSSKTLHCKKIKYKLLLCQLKKRYRLTFFLSCDGIFHPSKIIYDQFPKRRFCFQTQTKRVAGNDRALYNLYNIKQLNNWYQLCLVRLTLFTSRWLYKFFLVLLTSFWGFQRSTSHYFVRETDVCRCDSNVTAKHKRHKPGEVAAVHRGPLRRVDKVICSCY